MSEPPQIILGITGASGAIYAQRLLQLLHDAGAFVHAIASTAGQQVACHELGLNELSTKTLLNRQSDQIRWHDNADLFAAPSSGSTPMTAMVICPASSNTVAALAAGLADTLLRRAAYVTLKQRRPLIIVHREMPLTTIDLQNLTKLSQAGATICPAAPPFYHQPKSIPDLVDAVVSKIADLLNIPHHLPTRWTNHYPGAYDPPPQTEMPSTSG